MTGKINVFFHRDLWKCKRRKTSISKPLPILNSKRVRLSWFMFYLIEYFNKSLDVQRGSTAKKSQKGQLHFFSFFLSFFLSFLLSFFLSFLLSFFWGLGRRVEFPENTQQKQPEKREAKKHSMAGTRILQRRQSEIPGNEDIKYLLKNGGLIF